MSFDISTTHPNVLKKWAQNDLKQGEHQFFYNSRGIIRAEGEGGVIVYKGAETTLDSGDRIRLNLPGLLDGAGQGDNGRLDNNEEALNINYDEVILHERAHAVDLGGKMTNQRLAFDAMRVGRRELSRWRMRKVDYDMTAAAHGLGNEAANIATVNKRCPNSANTLFCGQTAAGTFTNITTAANANDAYLSQQTATNYLFGTLVLQAMCRKAYDMDPYIDPVMMDGGRPVYFVEISIWQAKALMQETAWIAAQREMVSFAGEQSPLFKKALGVWAFGDGYAVIHVNPRAPIRKASETFFGTDYTDASGSTANNTVYASMASPNVVASAVLHGQNSLMYGQGAGWRLFPYYGDAGGSNQAKRWPRIGTDAIYGVAAMQRKDSSGTALKDVGRVVAHTMAVTDGY